MANRRRLRPHQERALDLLRESLRSGKRRPVLQAPTGWGKTVVAGSIIRAATEKKKRVCFVVPAISLIDQAVESFMKDGITDIGVIQGDHPMQDWSKPVQVASIQTVARRGYPDADLVLVDEVHKLFEAQKKWMQADAFKSVPFIGLSATPWTKGLGKHYDDLIISATTQELIDLGFLSPFRVYAPAHPDLSGVKTVAGDYHEGQLSEAMNKAPLVANVVETWLKLGEGRPTLAFAVDRAHAKAIQRQFEESDIPCGYVDAFTDVPERAAIKDKFHRGEYPVVASVGTLTTGVDWDVRCIILARPTRSEMLFTQIIGRGLRTADGKADCIILDHSDTHTRLGFVTDIHHDTLDDGTEKSKQKDRKDEPLPKECPKCHYLRPAKVAKCPACGHEPKGDRKGAEHAEGKLAELRATKEKVSVPAGHVRIGASVIHEDAFLAQLKGYGDLRGFKPGWAAVQFKDATGKWPRHEVKPANITGDVASWIKSRMIRYAKRKEATNVTLPG